MSVIFHAINCIPRFAPETAFWCVSFVLITRTSLWTFVSLCHMYGRMRHCILCMDVCVTVSYVWTSVSLCPMYGRMCHCVLRMDVCVTVSYVWTYVSLCPMYGRMCQCVLSMDVCVCLCPRTYRSGATTSASWIRWASVLQTWTRRLPRSLSWRHTN